MKVLQDKYVDHKELTDILLTMEKEYPSLVKVESAGKSLEGRDIWAVTITNSDTGSDSEKPAIFVDACVHAGEVTGTQVCLYLMDYLLDNFNKDSEVTRLLSRRTFYIIPRINPDGAERFLKGAFESWGNMRPFPEKNDWTGLERCDVDDNDLLLLMRIPDKNGEWKISKKDPRLMVSREAYEYDGEYYRIYPEGRLVGENVNIEDFKVLPREFQLNMNRNYPEGWNIRTSIEEGGQYPLSEPEVNAVAKFVMNHPNIGALHDFHTYGGVVLRPYSYKGDDKFILRDLEIYNQVGEIGKKITGYEMISVFEGFTTTFETPRRGCLDDWGYENLGILSLGTELWNMARMAGIKEEEGNYYPYQKKTEEEELTMLRWNDEHLDSKGFIDWFEFNHPQLGKVELGGWNWKFTYKNPPVKFLEEECRKNSMFCIKQANLLPELEVKSHKIEKIEGDIYKVALVIENAGFLPTYVMEKALEVKVAKEVMVSMEKNDNIEIIQGEGTLNAGHIQGRFRTDNNIFFGDPTEGVPRKTRTLSWIIRVKKLPLELNFNIHSEKAGYLKYAVLIE